MRARQFWIPAIVVALLAASGTLHAQTPMGTAFTYQGQLKQTGLPVTNKADVKFSLWDDVTTPPGIQAGPTLVFDGQPGNPGPVDVVNGLFTVVLDFGTGIFTGDARWLEIEVRVPHDPGNTLPYTTLSPRQELTPTAYAIYAETAGSASGGVTGSGTVGRVAKFTGSTAIGDSAIYESAGKVGIGKTNPQEILDVVGPINSDSVYKIAGNTVLSTSGTKNLFAGVEAGANNTTGQRSTFAGYQAGYSNTTGGGNQFLGCWAGYRNTTGNANTFLGYNTGVNNTTGYENVFLGGGAGGDCSTGAKNTCVGFCAGANNTTGNFNTSLGWSAGYNTIGSGNVFIGYEAGWHETGSNKLYIANGQYATDTLIYGDFSSTQIGIGTTNPGSFMLAVNGSAAKPGGGAWSVFSDRGLKKNVEPLDGALEQLLALHGVTFEYKDPEFKFGLPGRQIGMIAQEVERVFPDWVDEDADGYKYVTVRGLEALVVEALRDLRDEKDGQIAAQQKEISALRARLERIETLVGDLANTKDAGAQ